MYRLFNVESAMDFFAGARVIRLRSFNQRYLMAMEDMTHVDIDEDGSSDGARWTVEIIANEQRLRLWSSWNRYLASDHFMVSQQLPDRVPPGGGTSHAVAREREPRHPMVGQILGPVLLGRGNHRGGAPATPAAVPSSSSDALFHGSRTLLRASGTVRWIQRSHPIPHRRCRGFLRLHHGSHPLLIHQCTCCLLGHRIAGLLPRSFYLIILFRIRGVLDDHRFILADLDDSWTAFFPKLMNLFEATLILESSCRPRSPPCFSLLNAQLMDREINYRIANNGGFWNPAYERTLTFTGTSTSEVIRRLKEEMRIEDIYVCSRHRRTGCLMALGGELPHMFEYYNDLVVFIALLPREFLRLLSSASSLLSEELFLDCFLFTDQLAQTFQTATAYHLQSVQTNRYLVAEGDLLHLRIDSSSMGARWTIDVIANNRNEQRIRFRSCFGWCLSASMTWYSLQRLASEDNAMSPQMVEVIEAGRDEWLPLPACGYFIFRGTLDDLLAAGYPLGQNPELDGESFHMFNNRESCWCNMYDLVAFLWCIRACEPTFPATDDPIARQQQNGQS
ncbi:hypothetical protein BHE74_00054891 [Ensete ventricosum]|nr:hypothetical protein BHE74_00054891 [Ensete ventricosum]